MSHTGAAGGEALSEAAGAGIEGAQKAPGQVFVSTSLSSAAMRLSMIQVQGKDEGLDRMFENTNVEVLSSEDDSLSDEEAEGMADAGAAGPGAGVNGVETKVHKGKGRRFSQQMWRSGTNSSLSSQTTTSVNDHASDTELPILAQYPFGRRQTMLDKDKEALDPSTHDTAGAHSGGMSPAESHEDLAAVHSDAVGRTTSGASSLGGSVSGSQHKAEDIVEVEEETEKDREEAGGLREGGAHQSASQYSLQEGGSIRTTAFAHQAGGARELRKPLDHSALVAKPCCKREAWFYRNGGSLKQFAPRFHGIKRSDTGVPAVLLEDLTSGYRRPCVLDVKMGVCTAAPDRTAVKQARCKQKDKQTTTGSVGARICGLRAYQVESGEYTMYDKVWGNQLKFDEFGDGIAKFFDNGSRRRRVLAKRFVEMLQPLRKMMAEQGLYRFYASSILFIYEGSEEPEEEVEVGDNWLEQCDLECKANVKMIDFAHVFPIGEGHGSRDNSYRCGLDNLLRVLEGIGNGLSGNEFKLIDHSGHDELHVHCLCGQDPVRSDWNYMSGSRSGNCTPLEKTPAKTPASSPVVY